MPQRRTVLAGTAAALAIAATPKARAETNPLAAFIAPDGASIKAVHVTADDQGGTAIADIDVAADKSPYPLFKQFLTHNATATAVYGVPPHHKIAGATNAGKALLFVADGVTVLKAGGTTRRCPAGTVILLDGGSGGGLREEAGPAGYTAIKVQLAD